MPQQQNESTTLSAGRTEQLCGERIDYLSIKVNATPVPGQAHLPFSPSRVWDLDTLMSERQEPPASSPRH
ncbi:hypothetical protein E2C01_091925 [Portunus trituberculatus]|uniref:Uncharacterized protein n=1 Tax=Portunus trituberculatus TaxID=210409 RepID=A0A5B7JWG5_PORTR|nr:hypothetical protein [Portunus trituberculatus]